jgi:hypothetical protein
LPGPPCPIHSLPKIWLRLSPAMREPHVLSRWWGDTWPKSTGKSFTKRRWHTAPVSLLGKATGPTSWSPKMPTQTLNRPYLSRHWFLDICWLQLLAHLSGCCTALETMPPSGHPNSQCRTVGIAAGYTLDDREAGVRVPVGLRIFGSPCLPNRLWGPLSLLSIGTGALSPGVKRQEREADHSIPTLAEDKKTWIYTSTSQCVFMEWRLVTLAKRQRFLLCN